MKHRSQFVVAVTCMVLFVRGGFCSEEGMLTVKTVPDGIEVWLNGKYVGDAPIVEKKLKEGRYELTLVDPVQHASTTEEVFIQAGQTSVVEKTVKAKFGSLRINSDPEGADVYLSSMLGQTPVSHDFMNPGKYRLEIQHPNRRYEPVTEDIVIPRGETVTLTKTLRTTTPFDLKALVRLGLGAGAVLGYVWAIVEHGTYRHTVSEIDNAPSHQAAEAQGLPEKRDRAGVRRVLGIVAGSVCVVGFEIVAFF